MHRPSTVRCYDCNQQVAELKIHRNECPNSRKNRSKLTSQPTKVNSSEPEIDFYALLDVSGSMEGHRLTAAKTCLSAFFETMREHDRLAIVSFDNEAFFKLKPRPVGQLRRQNELPGILSRIFAKGTTALYDAIHLTVSQIRDKTKKTIINVLTDGQDNSSTHSYAEVLALVQSYPGIQLNIVHIDETGTPIINYQELCKSRGEYLIIKETQIITEVTRVYQVSYHL